MGIMLLFAFLLLVVCATLAIVALYVRSNPEARSTYIKIKQKIFWNAFIRYVLQSTLKSQVGAGAVMAVTLGLAKQHQGAQEKGEDTGNIYAKLAIPAAMLAFFNICPIVFICILKRNKKHLNSPEVRQKYGQMYETIRVEHIEDPQSVLGQVTAYRELPDWNTLTYPIVFLLRRSIFVIITFGLFNYPGI